MCGNKQCEFGEICDTGTTGSCSSCHTDCPVSIKTCLTSTVASKQCSGHGTCLTMSGTCSCHHGYAGDHCQVCPCVLVSLCPCVLVSLCPCVLVSLCLCVLVSLCPCVLVSVVCSVVCCLCLTVSSSHCLCARLLSVVLMTLYLDILGTCCRRARIHSCRSRCAGSQTSCAFISLEHSQPAATGCRTAWRRVWTAAAHVHRAQALQALILKALLAHR